MNLQQITIDDQVLDNYVYLRDVVLGNKRLVVKKQIQQEIKNKSCKLCRQEFKPRSAGAMYCGDRRIRLGCAYKVLVKAGEKAGRITQLRNKYKTLKKLWEED